MTPGTPMTISFKQMLIPSTANPKAELNEHKAQLHVHNTPGMKPCSHNAFWKKGVSVRSVCIVLIKARLLGNSTRKCRFMKIIPRLLKRAAPDPPSLPNGIASPGFSV
jgi:hypothetical protein